MLRRRGHWSLVRFVHVFQIGFRHVLGTAHLLYPPVFHEEGPVAQAVYGGSVMADEKRGTLGNEAAQEAHTFLREKGIAYRQGLVDDQHVSVHMGHHGKGQTHHHAAGVAFDRLVDEVADVRKGHDVVVAGVCFFPRQAEDGGIEVDVLAAREFGVEAAAQLQESGHTAFYVDASR